MKIADFFAAIGIKVTGAQQLDKIDAALRSSATSAAALIQSLTGLEQALLGVKQAAVQAQQGVAGATKAATTANQQVTQTAQTATAALNKTQQAKQQVTKQTKQAAVEVGKMAATVGGLSAALAVLVRHGTQTSVWLKNFALQTGLSTDALQRWAYAAGVSDVSAAELTETLKGLQTLQAQIAMGLNNDLRPWTMLGINPADDPTKVLEDLRKNLKEMPVDVGRMYAQQIGISDAMFQFLRNSNAVLEQRYLINQREQKNLIELNRAWNSLAFKIGVAKDKLVAVMAVPLRWLVNGALALVDAVTWLVDTLDRIPFVGAIVRGVIMALTVAMVAFTVAVGVGTAAILSQRTALILWAAAGTGATVMFKGLAWASMMSAKVIAVITPAMVVAAGKVALVAAALAAVVIAVQDVVVYLRGGKSAFQDFSDWIEKSPIRKAILSVFHPLKNLVDSIKLLRRLISEPLDLPKWFKSLLGAMTGNGMTLRSVVPNMERFLTAPKASGSSNNVQQTIKVDTHIDGAQDPKRVATEVDRNFRRTLADASYQIPLPSY